MTYSARRGTAAATVAGSRCEECFAMSGSISRKECVVSRKNVDTGTAEFGYAACSKRAPDGELR